MASKDFRQDLAGIRQRLEDERQRLLQAERARRALEAESARNKQLFRDSIGDATPLARSDRAQPPRPRVLPRPLRPASSMEVASTTPFSDGPDDFTRQGADESEAYARDGIDQRTVRRLQRGDWPVRGQLDLHGMTRDQARSATESFLRDAAAQGWRCIRLIHGKGLGSADQAPVLKTLVRRWLRQSAPVLAYTDAPAAAGGSGALLVLLKAAGSQPTAHP